MSPHSRPIVIAIVEDHPIVIEGLRKILSRDLPVQEIVEHHTGAGFLRYLASNKQTLDVVLLDITLPDANGVELCAEIKRLSPGTVVLGFSNHSDRSLVLQLLSQGASGYLLKNATAAEIIQCITEALQGQISFSDQIKQIIAKPSANQLKPIPPLTKREKQVLRMIADEKTSTEISEELMVSPFTIETHRRNLMQKFGAKNVVGLIKIATELRLL
ncbi:response regulator transcription factor [Chryseolinea lacunae]|uniref:Response regulator transcription factor n=1 Tax=Chryseolinea lacunae TaxID=2801331 RepID=A0ABS1KPN6_9BACT|nr:response regulator transcription factor [Chryseolinea lacunae]MBL0741438.1 response regulator transcription factor [Chryseolinea lacunae]